MIHPAPKPKPGKRRTKPKVVNERDQAKAELKVYRANCRLTVIARARGLCEWPLDPGHATGTDWHHICGRGGKGIREPHASSPALTIWLCKHHHGLAHSVVTVRELLRLTAANRLGISVDLTVTTPLRAIREALAA